MRVELWFFFAGAVLFWLAVWAFLRVTAWVEDIDRRLSNAVSDAKYAYDRAWKATNELDDLREHLDLTYSEPGRAKLVKRA